ncbi:hypothetical protein [Vibrio cholerae]|nr:hypothetical protein [Vibrio cholerae]
MFFLKNKYFFKVSKYSFCLIFIISFFSSLYSVQNISSENLKYSRKDATGFKVNQATQFFYFYKHLSLFPLATDRESLKKLKDNAQAAEAFIVSNPDKIRMEIGHWYRFGESARIWALYPSYLFGDRFDQLSLRPFSAILFVTTAIILFFGVYRCYGVITSILASSLLLSSPFILSESFLVDNVFSIQPMLHIFSISIFFIFTGYSKQVLILVSLFLSIVSGVFSEIRGENITVLFVPLLYWLICIKVPALKKLLIIAMISVVFFTTKFLIRSHFESTYESTSQVVRSVGGVVFDGGVTGQHPIWHPLLAGLGDFGQDKGFLWSDRDIFIRILSKAGYSNRDISEVKNSFYDPDTKFYYKRPETLGRYASLARAEFINTVTSDPIWYVGILVKRAVRIVFDIPPVTIYFFKNKIEINLYVLTVIFVALGFLLHGVNYIRCFNKIDLFALLASLSMSSLIFIVHTGNGATYSSLLPLILPLILFGKILSAKQV